MKNNRFYRPGYRFWPFRLPLFVKSYRFSKKSGNRILACFRAQPVAGNEIFNTKLKKKLPVTAFFSYPFLTRTRPAGRAGAHTHTHTHIHARVREGAPGRRRTRASRLVIYKKAVTGNRVRYFVLNLSFLAYF